MSAAQLELAAAILGPVLDEVVFVGGATIHLWLTDPVVPPVRATDDVDVVCEVASRSEYYRLGEELHERGLREATEEPVICRWLHSRTGLAIDVMPALEEILGFSNPWYLPAIEKAERRRLDNGHIIRAATPPPLMATKLAAWRGRGRRDLLASLDVHDALTLIDGRQEILKELAAADRELRSSVATELGALRDDPFFDYAVQSATAGYGALSEQRAVALSERVDDLLRQMSA